MMVNMHETQSYNEFFEVIKLVEREKKTRLALGPKGVIVEQVSLQLRLDVYKQEWNLKYCVVQ